MNGRELSLKDRFRNYRSSHPALMFVSLFGGTVILFYVLRFLPFFHHNIFPAYLHLNAKVSAFLLNIANEHATVTNGSTLITPRYSLNILAGCDALEPIGLFIAVVIAFPALWRKKLIGVFVGTIFLFCMNQVRIISLYYTGIHYPSAFETMHIEVWQVLFIILALLCWVTWIRWSMKNTKPNVTA